MSVTVAQSARSRGLSRTGRPSATTVATIEANMDAIARDTEEEAALKILIDEERIAMAHCRCANKKLHAIDCELAKLLAKRESDLATRRAENAKLSKLIVPDNEAGHAIVRVLDTIAQRIEREAGGALAS